jgi:hypothetical protein
VKKCKKLLSLYASDNNLMSINVKNNTKLQSLYISGNKKITSVNVSKNKALQHLGVAATSVKKLDLSRNTKLTSLDCYQTKLTSLNLKKNKKINSISFYGSKIAKLDLKKYNLLSINYEANVGETIKLKKYLGTGYKATHKSKNLTYNKKKNTIKVKKNEDEWGYVTLKKGKKTYYISIYIPENVMQMEKK